MRRFLGIDYLYESLRNMEEFDIKLKFLGKIDEENALMFLNNLKSLNDKYPNSSSLTIYISSSGGNVDMAVELYHFLRLLKCKIRTVNISYVNSASIILFSAGTERFCFPNSSFYLHPITKKLDGKFSYNDLYKEAKEMATNTDNMAEILMRSSHKNKSYWKRLINKGYLLTSKKANEIGFSKILSENELGKNFQCDIL